MNRLSRWILLGVLVVLCCGAAWAQSEESLGDIARKNKENAAAQKKPARVITEDDIPASSMAASSAPSSSSSAASSASSTAADSKDSGEKATKDAGKDDGSKTPDDPKKAEERKAALKLADGYEQDAKDLQRKYKQLQEKYDAETDPFRKMVMENELANSKDNVAAMQKKADDLRQQAGGGSATQPAAPADGPAPAGGQPPTQAPQ
jgi:hypothetical protein